MEKFLWACLHHLLSMQDHGIIMDAGAHDGSSSKLMADAFPNHIIYSIEPIRENVNMIQDKLRDYKNVNILYGGLGEDFGFGTYSMSRIQSLPKSWRQIGTLPQYKDRIPRFANDTVWYPIYPVFFADHKKQHSKCYMS